MWKVEGIEDITEGGGRKNSGVNFTNVLRTAFTYVSCPAAQLFCAYVCTFVLYQRNLQAQVGAKAARRMLMQLNPGLRQKKGWAWPRIHTFIQSISPTLKTVKRATYFQQISKNLICKYRVTLARKSSTKDFSEITTCGQFHQHFKNNSSVNFLLTKMRIRCW